jgi:alkanesulfonate monooxygenase SsuD/methylene tetrahydromethanopterin reductase-like flavin-dependent oxidoreductase (luciferase family)
LSEPRAAVAVWAICAETASEALCLSASSRMMMLHLYRGKLIPVPSVERALRYLEEEGVPMETLPPNRRLITGDPAKVRITIESVAAAYGAEEVFVVNIMHDHAARRRSYQLIAEAFALSRRPET